MASRGTPSRCPRDLGTVSDLVSLRGELALITDEVRSADAWSFDLWTTHDGTDWRPVGPTSFERHPDLLDWPRTILGFRSIEGGFAAFESYAPTGSDASTPQASPPPEDETARVFVWRTSDGRDWQRHEVEGPGRVVIGGGSRILEGVREQLYTVQPGFPPYLLVSADGTMWEDAGALVHALRDPEGATAIAPTGDDLLIVGRTEDPTPGTEEWAVFRGAPDGHWLHALTLPRVEAMELLVDRKVGIIAGTAAASGDGATAGGTHSFLASSVDRGRTWQEQPAMAEQDLCLGPLASIGDMALLGAGCAPSGGMSILAARLDAFDPATEPPPITTVPRTPRALECDFRGLGADSGPGVYGEGERGYADPEAAMRAFIREGAVIPQSGYQELARDETALLYGYKHEGEVKVAVRVTAVPGAEGGWVPERLIACRLAEYGRTADMGRGVWLWANRWARTVQERVGPAHCDWQSTRFLYWAPPGTPDTLRTTSLFVRDPRGVFRDRWTVPFLRSTTLPSDARYTGFRRDARALWLAADERAMYVKDGDRVERWPRIRDRYRLRLNAGISETTVRQHSRGCTGGRGASTRHGRRLAGAWGAGRQTRFRAPVTHVIVLDRDRHVGFFIAPRRISIDGQRDRSDTRRTP